MKENIDLLYVEDNADYVDFVGRAVKKIDSNLVYDYVTDGKDAIEYLNSCQSDDKIAKIILLDIHLPGMDGFKLLKKIRSIERLRYTPVIMFSSSDNPEDIKAAYDFGANAYLVKPSGLKPLTDTLKTVCDFWLSLNYSEN